MKRLIEICEILIIVLVITFLLNTYFFTLFKVFGSSMESTLYAGDIVLVRLWGGIEKEDIVSFYEPDEKIFLVKRIIGTPGDKIEGDGENISITGTDEDFPYVGEAFSFELMNDEYYLIGDNIRYSKDSRDFGPIKKDRIKGKVLARVWPILRRE